MPTKSIPELPIATTPLNGTELVPIMQGGITKHTSGKEIANLAALPKFSPGGYYGPSGLTTTGTRTNGVMTVSPFIVGEAQAFDRIVVQVTVVGEAGSLLRLGIYSDLDGKAGALLLDAGTVDGATVGVKELVISQTLQPGVYWLASCTQAAVVTPPTCRVMSAGFRHFGAPGVATNLSGGAGWQNGNAGQGALPNPAAANTATDTVILVNLRAV